MAKPFFATPESPRDFGVGELPTSTYDIFLLGDLSQVMIERTASFQATIDVGSRNV